MANRRTKKEEKKIVIELRSFTQEEKEKLIQLRNKWDEDDRNYNCSNK